MDMSKPLNIYDTNVAGKAISLGASPAYPLAAEHKERGKAADKLIYGLFAHF